MKEMLLIVGVLDTISCIHVVLARAFLVAFVCPWYIFHNRTAATQLDVEW